MDTNWIKLYDCGKQLSIHSKIREMVNEGYKVYNINEVEFDQFHLELINHNGNAIVEKQHNILTCKQLIDYNFEVLV